MISKKICDLLIAINHFDFMEIKTTKTCSGYKKLGKKTSGLFDNAFDLMHSNIQEKNNTLRSL